ncbi:MAG: site-specific integrase [Chitinophagales bacterium]
MATTKVLLDKRRSLKDETYPLVIRIYKGEKYSTISLKTYLKPNQFDPVNQKVIGNHPNKKEINQKIRQSLIHLEKANLDLELREELISSEKIKETVIRPTAKLNFIEFGEKLIEEMRAVNRVGNANAYRDAVNALKNYSKRRDLQFEELNCELLYQIENKMLKAGLSKNSIAAYNRSLRAVFNRAINEGLVDAKFYPYRKYKIKGENTIKRNISKEQIKQIVLMDITEGTKEWHSRNYFMLSFNLIGMSFADMATIKPTDIISDRLTYKRHKTHKLYNIKLTAGAKNILDLYIQKDRTYILPIIPEEFVGNLEEERKYIQYGTKTCNKYLKRIGEELELEQELTTYVARHSWATIAKKMGFSKDLIAEALGHEYGNRITSIYLDSFDQDVIDEMNEKVNSL